MKIGIFGGSFDPFHCGHLTLAKTAKKALDLDKVLFFPTGNHPLKKNKTVLSADQRFQLIKKALQDYPEFVASRLDMQSDAPSYTSHLIEKLREIYPEDELFLIAGDDIVVELPKWHQWQWLLQNVQFIVARRPDTDRDNWDDLDYLEYFTFIDMKPHDISSTEIRRKLKKKEDITDLVPKCIEQEIKKLYT